MSFVTGKLQTGTYQVQNVSSSGFGTLKDANSGSSLVGTSDADSDNTKWTITLLSSQKYNAMSYVWATYSYAGATPSSGDAVKSRSAVYQWVIKETSTKGKYLISPDNDDSLFWGLVNSTDDTVIKLTATVDDKSTWQFVRATT